LLHSKDPLKTTAISSAEFLFGARMSGRKNAYEVSHKFLSFFPVPTRSTPKSDEPDLSLIEHTRLSRLRPADLDAFDELIARDRVDQQSAEPLALPDDPACF